MKLLYNISFSINGIENGIIWLFSHFGFTINRCKKKLFKTYKTGYRVRVDDEGKSRETNNTEINGV